jgi:PAS domain-containing protein
VTDLDGRCTYLNRAWYAFTGQDDRVAEDFGWLEAVHPDDRDWSTNVFLAANARRKPSGSNIAYVIVTGPIAGRSTPHRRASAPMACSWLYRLGHRHS